MRNSEIDILYLSRGLGFGHAMMDILVIEHLKELNPTLKIQIASYAEGYKAFVANGFEAIDLGLPVNNDIGSDAIIKIGSIIREYKPKLLTAHEMFIALPLAKIFEVPAILITHWFFENILKIISANRPFDHTNHPLIQYVKCSDHIIFVDLTDFHEIPKDMNVPVSFVGPIIRNSKYSLTNKDKIRNELELNKANKVILVTVGGGYSQRSTLIDTTVAAFEQFNDPRSKLVLLTGSLYQLYSDKYKNNEKIIVKDYDWNIDRLMVASDLVICAGTFTTLWELAFLGIPSISIPDKRNIVDRMHAQKMQDMNITVIIEPDTLNPGVLLQQMNAILGSKLRCNKMSQAALNLKKSRGQEKAAQIIADYLS